ncbi:coadhesin-like [Acropora millepora]|uniref:coadhesin-like n=1 Tax=Acropora millepora TaxID=45264 RepID=UPI001CF174FA|nr:coadhesin-like [Acropora millepora]
MTHVLLILLLFVGLSFHFSLQAYVGVSEGGYEFSNSTGNSTIPGGNEVSNSTGNTSIPVDGNWGEWGPWSECSRSCGGGNHSRTRECNNPAPANGGKQCDGPFRQRDRLCNEHECPVDGNWGEWSPWSDCSRSCGGGNHSRTRECNNPAPANGGKQCDGPFRQRDRLCNDHECPVDGIWASWTSWTPCSRTCGDGGIRERARLCDAPKPAFNGTYCQGVGFQLQECNNSNPCPVDGMWSSWSAWTACSKTCGKGIQTRTRICDNPKPANNGTFCLGDGVQEQICNTSIACQETGIWTSWSSCSKTCGKGMQKRQRFYNDTKQDYNGTSGQIFETDYRACFALNPCPVDGMWASWTKWTPCSKTCGCGIQYRNRFCNNPKPAYNGSSCSGDAFQRRKCYIQHRCPVDGMWGSWTKWSPCSNKCGRGIRYRKRFCNNPKPANNGLTCLGSRFQMVGCFDRHLCPARRPCQRHFAYKCYYTTSHGRKVKVCKCKASYKVSLKNIRSKGHGYKGAKLRG